MQFLSPISLQREYQTSVNMFHSGSTTLDDQNELQLLNCHPHHSLLSPSFILRVKAPASCTLV